MNLEINISSIPRGSIEVSAAIMSDKRNSVAVVPFVIPSEQEYYWTPTWQKAERAARADLEAGRFVEFSGEDPS